MTRSTTFAPKADRPATGPIAQPMAVCRRSPMDVGVAGVGSTAKNAGTAERLLDSLERVASVPVDGGPYDCCRQVVQEVAEYVDARWAVLAVRPGALPDTPVRLVARDPGGRLVTDARTLPAHIRSAMQWARANVGRPVLRAREMYLPLLVGGRSQGVLAAVRDIEGGVLDVDELAVRGLAVLASQAVVALHHYDVLHRNERTWSGRQQKLVADERNRLASELHETVARQILSAGMTVERCRSEVAVGSALHDQLSRAALLARAAVHQLRTSIHALTSASREQDLPTLLRRLAVQPATQPLDVTVEVRGAACGVPAAVTSAVLRIAGECLFNAVVHGRARRAAVALTCDDRNLSLVVGDDGDGDPAVVRRLAHHAMTETRGGYGRGLADIRGIVACLDGECEVGRSHLGGIQVRVRLPIRADASNGGERST